MKVGDLVKNLNSESRMHGIVVDFELRRAGGGFYSVRMPVVLWPDKRCSPTMPDMVEKVNESRR
jgi:hypothetical protein